VALEAVRVFWIRHRGKGATNKDCVESQMRSADYRQEAPWRISMSKMRVENESWRRFGIGGFEDVSSNWFPARPAACFWPRTNHKKYD
jgi:hypothetical protein